MLVPLLPHRAGLTLAGIKSGHGRGCRGLLPEGVEASAVEVAAFSSLVVLASGQFRPESNRLIGLDGGTANLLYEQPRNCQRLIANHLSRQSEARSSSQ